MKVLSMWEPWATLYVNGPKRIETRGWNDLHRGWTAIHATKGGLSQQQLLEICRGNEFYAALMDCCPRFREQIEAAARRKKWITEVFHPGHVIGVVNIVACHPLSKKSWMPEMFESFPELDTPRERAFGDYSEGRFGYLALETFVLPDPIPFKSRQGKFLDLPEEIAREIRQQYKTVNHG